jgi:hypothetical protein
MISGGENTSMKRRAVSFLALLVLLTLVIGMPLYAASTAAPTVTITSPSNGATVSGTQVLISADVYSGASNLTIRSVTYKIDNGSSVNMSGPVGATQGTFTAYWDSTKVSNGTHTIYVTATNSAKKTKTVSITVNVNNVTNPHANLLWSEYPSNCYSCHANKFNEVYQSIHYQWLGNAPDNINKPTTLQGKISNQVNAYCINTLGNWWHCGRCHAGRGSQPVYTSNPTVSQLLNIDCLMCHNEDYAMVRVRKSDGTMGPPDGTATDVLNGYVRNVKKPTRKNCLKCHAYAGGGDAVKRGDIAWAHVATTDRNFDVHMATTGGNLTCQSCHTFVNHKVTGRGSDISTTDYASEVSCVKSGCHVGKDSSTGHATAAINRHVTRVACQTCHIPLYARNASDTSASEATEIHRDWRDRSHHGSAPPYHPGNVLANNLTPVYKWWNRKSYNYLLFDTVTVNSETGNYLISKPVGYYDGPLGNKLYPFKYKTAAQPLRIASNQLIAIDTYEYILVSGDPDLATKKGLANMGFSSNDAYTWVTVDTYQLLNHQIAPKEQVLQCTSCHENKTRMDLTGKLGYHLKADRSVVCTQCHSLRNWKGYEGGHNTHVSRKKYDCSWCHTFTRPERGLITP